MSVYASKQDSGAPFTETLLLILKIFQSKDGLLFLQHERTTNVNTDAGNKTNKKREMVFIKHYAPKQLAPNSN